MPKNNVCKICARREAPHQENCNIIIQNKQKIEEENHKDQKSIPISSDDISSVSNTSQSKDSSKPRLYRSQSLPATSPRWDAAQNKVSNDLFMKYKEGGRSKESWVTMLQHYYPEGGWGWVILTVATLVAILNHGLHTSVGTIMAITAEKFHQPTHSIGK